MWGYRGCLGWRGLRVQAKVARWRDWGGLWVAVGRRWWEAGWGY